MAPKRKHSSIMSGKSKKPKSSQGETDHPTTKHETPTKVVNQALDQYFRLYSLKNACEEYEDKGEKLKQEIEQFAGSNHTVDDDCDHMIRDLKDLVADYDGGPRYLFEPLEHRLEQTKQVVLSALYLVMPKEVNQALDVLDRMLQAGCWQDIKVKTIEAVTRIMRIHWEDKKHNHGPFLSSRSQTERRHLIQLAIVEWKNKHKYRLAKGSLTALLDLLVERV